MIEASTRMSRVEMLEALESEFALVAASVCSPLTNS